MSNIKEEALKIGVPPFEVSYLKPETQTRYETMNEDEKEALRNQWYKIQIPQYEVFYVQTQIIKLQQEAVPLNIPQFQVSYLKPETQINFNSSTPLEKQKIMVKWYTVQIEHYKKAQGGLP